MVDHNERDVTGEFTMPADLAEAMIALATPRPDSRVLVVELRSVMTSLLAAQGFSVTSVRSDLPLKEQFDQIVLHAPYDVAMLGPIFNAQLPETPLLLGWDLGKRASEDWLIAHVVDSMKPNGRLVSLVPNGLLSNYGRVGIRKGLIERGLSLVATMPSSSSLNLFSISSIGLVLVEGRNTDPGRSITFLSFRDSNDLTPLYRLTQNIPTGQSTETDIVTKVTLPINSLSEELRLDPQYYDAAYLQIKAPEGYYETALGDIAEVKGGVSISKSERLNQDPGSNIPYLQVRHVLTDGSLSEELSWVSSETGVNNRAKLAKPGDILITIAGTVGKVTIVPPQYGLGVLFDTSLRRVHIVDDNVNPEAVFASLRSDLGQLQFQRLTGGTVIPQINSPVLETMRIFLPHQNTSVSGISEPDTATVADTVLVQVNEVPLSISDPVTQASLIADSIESSLVNYLRAVKPTDGDWRTRFEMALRSVSHNFLTKTLSETVIQEFPTPIAIVYRRYQMARYNYYERLNRMISVVESCIYLAFHVLLSDYCNSEWRSRITLSSDAKQAVKGKGSIDYRLKFIKEVCDAARTEDIKLFMPELINCKVVEVGDLFREQVRNIIAHSAPGSEPYVRSLTDQYAQHVEQLLDSLKFLAQYTMCRVRNHYFEKGQWHYQAEIYKGAEYDFNIQEVANSVIFDEENPRLIQAEREHLVLSSPDIDVLDLYPFYQLYFGDETARESHLCYLKQRKQNVLVGESVRSSVELSLEGIGRFIELTDGASDANSQST